jgi:DNA-binding LytR/AlgR family response regulator
MKVKCLIVDDEDLALDILEAFIKKTDFLQLEGRCKSAMEAISILNKKKIDLVFLDIQMPEITGIQLLKNIQVIPSVIITTAYPNYAVEGFELDVMDYLLKPIPFERFLKAVNRYLAKQTKNAISPPVESAATTQNEESFFVKSDKRMIRVATSDILYIESIRNYVDIHLKDNDKIKTLTTIGNLEEKLPPGDFLRIHRSFIVAIKKIQSYTPGSVLIGGKYLALGRNYKQYALSILNKKSIQ